MIYCILIVYNTSWRKENNKEEKYIYSIILHLLILYIYGIFFFYPNSRTFFSLLSGRKEEKERERERDINMREKHQLATFSYAPQQEIKPATWVCGLTRNQTHDPLAYRMMLQPTEPHHPGQWHLF